MLVLKTPIPQKFFSPDSRFGIIKTMGRSKPSTTASSTLVIVSGYFNPLHGGHLDMIEAASDMGDKLIVVVNNDRQQLLKKGTIILDESNRVRLIKSLRIVDEVVLSIDEDPTIVRTLEKIAEQNLDKEIIFANGGDRDTSKEVPETSVCRKYNIKMVFDAGGKKYDSSTRINLAVDKASRMV